MNRISDVGDRLRVVFDEESLVADAGLLMAGTLISRRGLERLLDETVRLGGRVGGSRPGRKGGVDAGGRFPYLIMPISYGRVPPRGCCLSG